VSNVWIYGVGLLAQLLFSARLLVQWVKSERAGKVISPTLFWELSLLASLFLMVYGILRDDIVIILGQTLSYFIYIRNLQFKNAWNHIPMHFKLLVFFFPLAAIVWLSSDFAHNWNDLTNNKEISEFLLTWGSMGQVIFTIRFVYQWYFSEQQKRSVLPVGFWAISLVGSAMIMSYGVLRKDPILILGQSFGIFIYIRNLHLAFNKRGVTQ
jgi:lipid-A-disaccharide synthase-like uncharacterized protein